MSAVADTGGNGDDGFVHEAGNHAGQGTFHSGNDDEDVGPAQDGELAQNSLQAGDADVVDFLNAISHEVGGEGGFFGDGNVAGAGAGDDDSSGLFGERLACQGEAARLRVMLAFWKGFLESRGGFGLYSGNEHGLPGLAQCFCDAYDLLGSFAGAENDFGETLPLRPVNVHFGVF